MSDYDDDPLDLLEDDGDGVNDTLLFFDEKEKGQQGHVPQTGSGCCVVLFLVSSALVGMGYVMY